VIERVRSAPLDTGTVVAVTGATGYIGSVLCKRLLADGFGVRALSRTTPSPEHRLQHVFYDLRAEVQLGAVEGAIAVIHLASETRRGASTDLEMELLSVQRLLRATGMSGARFVFVSSQTASQSAPTSYGRAKMRIEQEVLAHGGLVVRPGLVYGGLEAGLFGTLCRFIRTYHAFPWMLPAPMVQIVHVDDLSRALVTASCSPTLGTGVISIAEPTQVPFHRFLAAIAEYRIDRVVCPVPLPLIILLPCLDLLHWFLGTKIDPGQLRSLIALPPLDTQSDLDKLKIRPVEIETGLCRSGKDTRQKLIEARTILGYILGTHASFGALRRYVRAMETVNDTRPLRFNRCLRAVPSLLIFFDQPVIRKAAGGAAFFRRVELATAIAEATPQHFATFVAESKGFTALSRVALLGVRLCCEAVVQITVFPLRRIILRQLRAQSSPGQ
jgi:nucleoside-diphosphate-sugar epimerase